MSKKNSTKQRGQVAMLFALLMPIFLLFVGVALDLGWYYLNVSRLQNAADAAAVAGAQTIVDSKTGYFSGYKNISLVDKYPGKVSNEYRPNDSSEKTAIDNGEEVARDYVDKNLASAKYGSSVDAWTKTIFFAEPLLYEKDDNLYYVVKISEEIRHFFLPGWFDDMDAPVTAVALISKTASDDSPQAPSMLETDEPLPTAPTRISTEPLVEALVKAGNKNVIIGNWEIQNLYRQINNTIDTSPTTGVQDPETGEWLTEFNKHFGYNLYEGKWNQYADWYNHYKSGDHRRVEKVSVVPQKTGIYDTPGSNKQGAGDGWTTPANGKYLYKEDEVDSLNIDFKSEVIFGSATAKDWDLPLGYDGSGISKLHYIDWDVTVESNGIKKTEHVKYQGEPDNLKDKLQVSDATAASLRILNDPAALMRIHMAINFDENHLVRTDAEDSTDILWVRIESEPMLNYPDILSDSGYNLWIKKSSSIKSEMGKTITNLNSVRQIIINMNSDNTVIKSDGSYMYRPVAIFYDGPERYTTSNDIRDSKPVIVNLNQPFNGILYMPNSPVVLNHGENLNGFIVAKEYLQLKKESDFESITVDGEVRYYSKGKEYYKITDVNNDGVANDPAENAMFIDDKGEVQYKSLGRGFNRNVGKYNTFGRTEFSSHDYIINPTSASTLLLADEEK